MSPLPPRSSAKRNFLPHIQGLRGIAIALIILFHLLPSFCPYGYICVDVFLVISGYFLIGSQLAGGEDFQFFDFCRKKIARILPPILATVIVVQLAQVAIFPADEMLKAGQLTRAVLWGYGNQELASLASNYFSTSARALPLMHLWYIGVLLQGYLFFGILFLIWRVCKLRKAFKVASVIVIMLLSLLLFHPIFPAEWGGYGGGFYYFTLPRLWEFSAGGLLCLLPSIRYKRLLQVCAAAALLTLLIGAFRHCPETIVRLLRLTPTHAEVLLGATLGCILVYAGQNGICGRILDYSPVKFVGKISYSLYLLHWPVICFAEFIVCGSLPASVAAGLCIAIFLLTLPLWYGIESKRIGIGATLLLWLTAFAFNGAEYLTDGYRDIFHRKANKFSPGPVNISPVTTGHPLLQGTEKICPTDWRVDGFPKEHICFHIGKEELPVNFVVLGDSHARDVAFGMHLLSRTYPWHGVFCSCYTVPFWNIIHDKRIEFRNPTIYWDKEQAEQIFRWLNMHPELHSVFIAQKWSGRFGKAVTWDGVTIEDKEEAVRARKEGLRNVLLRLQEMGRDVYVFTDSPAIPEKNPLTVLKSHVMFHPEQDLPESMTCTQEQYNKANYYILPILQELEEEGLCTILHREKDCFPNGVFRAVENGKAFMLDDNHLTADGILYTLRGLESHLKSIILPPAPPRENKP